MRKKDKVMTAIAMAAEGLELAGEVLGTIRKRSMMAGRSAGEVVSNLRDNTADVAEQLVDTVKEKLSPRRSSGARAWQFAAGVGVGVGAASIVRADAGCEDAGNFVQGGDPLQRCKRGDGDERLEVDRGDPAADIGLFLLQRLNRMLVVQIVELPGPMVGIPRDRGCGPHRGVGQLAGSDTQRIGVGVNCLVECGPGICPGHRENGVGVAV